MHKVPISNAAAAVRTLLRDMQKSAWSVAGPIDGTVPVADPQQRTNATALSFFHNTSRLIEGIIVDTAATGYAYRVQLSHMAATAVCYSCGASSSGAFGARDLHTYTTGQRVLVALDPRQLTGWIIGGLPDFSTAGILSPQMLLGTTRQRVDYAHLRPLVSSTDRLQICIPSATGGRIVDATTSGEWGMITETGMRIFLDSFMAMFGCDEATALSVFYDDQLVRLAAYNYQFWTAGCEQEALDDEGEYNDWIGFTPYPWEQLGMYSPVPATKEVDSAEWIGAQATKPWLFKREPLDTHQAPWHRYREFRGYLGQGYKRVVQAPPQPINPSTSAKYSPAGQRELPPVYPLLFSETVLLDGTWMVESAKQIAIVKRIGGISPTRLKRPEQPAGETAGGDDNTNYRAAGLGENGKEHKITSAPEATGTDKVQQRVAAIFDLHGYLFNYAGSHPFHWHYNDWYIPEMQEMDYAGGAAVNVAALQFNQLARQQNIAEPSKVELEIDHRYGKQPYYQTQAGFTLLDDGSVVLYDGYGSSITMSQGHIYFDAPGDIFVRAGRNVINWAGNDVHVRARDCVDISTSRKDIRIKAEKNMQVLAGNSGEGGVLIESRAREAVYDFSSAGEAVKSAGVVLRAQNSDVVTLSRNAYIRTGGGSDSSNSRIQQGNIVLDAAKGYSSVVINALQVQEFLGYRHQFCFGQDGDTRKTTEFSEAGGFIDGVIRANGAAVINGAVIGNGAFASPNGVAMMAPIDGATQNQINSSLQDVEQYAADQIDNGNRGYEQALANEFYAEQKIGADANIDLVQFAFRTPEDYGTTAFQLPQPLWQQLAQAASVSLPRWQEPSVESAVGDSYPYPGKFDQDRLIKQELKFFDGSNYARRGQADGGLTELYASPELAAAELGTLNDYIITGDTT